MADDFRALIEEQKKTTAALLKGEQRAETDADIAESQHKDKIKSDLRIEAGRKAWQTRQANKELSAGGAAAKEDQQEQAATGKKTQNLLKKIAGGVTGMFGKMNEKIKGAGKGFMAMLKTTLLAGFMLALLAFLQSDEWKKMKVWIVDKLVPKLKDFWTKTLKPFVDNILTFIKDPSWDTFGNIFGGVENKSSLLFAVAGLAFLFRPIRTTMLAGGLLFKGMKGLVGMFGKEGILNKAVRKFTGMGDKLKAPKGGPPEGTKKVGRLRQIASKASKSIGDGLRSVWGKSVSIVQKAGTGIANIATRASGFIRGGLTTAWDATGKVSKWGLSKLVNLKNLATTGAKTIAGALKGALPGMTGIAKAGAGKGMAGAAKLGKMMLRGAKFIPGAGLAVTGALALYDGLTAGMTEFKKSGDLGKAIKEGTAGALSGVTFGLVSQKTFSDAFTTIGDKFTSLSTGVSTAATKAWGTVKDLIPTEEGLKTSFTKLKDNLAPLSKIKLPTEVSFSAIKESVGTMATALNTSFANITGIDVSASLTKIGTGVASKATALVKSFENITGIDVSATLTGIKSGVASTATKLVSSFEEITGIKVPNFGEKLSQFTSSIPQWIKNNIFDPGAAGRGGSGAGSPMKIFGMELKFPSLNISFSGMADKIKSLLPEWLTNPVGYIKGLVSDMAKLLPGFGDDKKVSEMSKEEVSKETKQAKKEIAAATKMRDFYAAELKKLEAEGKGEKSRAVTVRRLMGRYDSQLSESSKRLKEMEAAPKMQMGGPVTKGKMYNSHFSSGELFVPSSSGMILSAQKTERIMQAGLQRGTAAGAGAAGPAIVNAPVNTVNNSQTNTTVSSTELKHPSAILASVNIAA